MMKTFLESENFPVETTVGAQLLLLVRQRDWMKEAIRIKYSKGTIKKAKELLEAYGFVTPKGLVATSAEQAGTARQLWLLIKRTTDGLGQFIRLLRAQQYLAAVRQRQIDALIAASVECTNALHAAANAPPAKLSQR